MRLSANVPLLSPFLLLSLTAPLESARGQSRSTGFSENSVVSRAKTQPDTLRDALSRTLSAVVASRTVQDRASHLDRARRYAGAYAKAWDDPFFSRQVQRFAAAPPVEQREFVLADSLRRSGIAVLPREGAAASMTRWRESLRHARASRDESAVAPVLLAIGAGFYRLAEFDSASAYLKGARDLAIRTGDRRTNGNAIGILASVTKDRGDSDAAAGLYRQAFNLRALSGDTRGMAADQNNLALLAQERGDLREATQSFKRALEINRRDNRPSEIALNLSNLALIESTNGEYARSESLYAEALALDRKNGNLAEAAFVLHGMGKLYVNRGDYKQAEAALREALRIHEASGSVLDAVAVRIDLASVETGRGNPETARMLLQHATRSAIAANASSSERAALALARGNLAVQFGTFADADNEYAESARLYRVAGDSTGMAQALEGQALLLHARGNDAVSLRLLNDARRIHVLRGDRRSAALTNLLIGDVQMSSGDFRATRQALGSALRELRELGDIVGEAAAQAAAGDLAAVDGSHSNAAALYRAGLKRLAGRQASEVRWRLHTGLARALRRNGSLESAAAELRLAIESAERSSSGLRLEERRSGYLADKWSAYSDLALIELNRGRAGEAFVVSEQMRARQMLDLLQRGRVGIPTGASMQEQDLRRRIAQLTERLETKGIREPAVREPVLKLTSVGATRADLNTAQKAYERLLSQLRENDPGYAALVSAKPRTWKEVAARLKRDEVLLEYMLSDSACTVFVVTTDTVRAVDLGVTRKSLTDLVEFSHKTMDLPRGGTAQELWRAPLRRLYGMLVKPVADKGYLRGKKTLLIAPHGELHFLSFASLIVPESKNQFLVERFDISYTPSATVWVQLGGRLFKQREPGVLALAPNVDRLPASRREVQAIGRIYGKQANVKLGAAATPSALRAALPTAGTIHLATFGVLNKHNPLFSFIELAPGAKEDGRLEVNEVFGLRLSGQIVILSACQTALASGALADVPPGDDWVGLVQAFLQAGASSVLATLWPVDDRATSELMEGFHKKLSTGMTPISALGAAQRAMIRNPATSKPVYWAGFTASGRSE